MAGPIRIAILADASRFNRTIDRTIGSTNRLGGTFRGIAKGAAAFGLVSGAAAVFTAKVGSDYVKSLNQIQALTGATSKQMDTAAKALESNSAQYAKFGQSTGDAAAGVVELAKSGLTLQQSLDAIRGTMTLAKAGELEVADASAITANALNTFHLKAKRAGDVANYLANAANISSADVADIADSFKYVAPVAAKAGVSIQETNAILAELANSGIKASQAGTSLRTFLLNLEAPTTQASAAMKDLGINVYTASGQLKPIGDVIQILQDKLKGLSDADRNTALKSIFGKTGIAGAITILDEGKKGLEKYTKGIERAGAASKLAQSRSKGLAGSFSIIVSSAKSGAQSIYRQFSPIADKVVRPLAKKFADLAQNIGPDLAKAAKKVKPLVKPLENLAGIAWGKFTAGVDALRSLSKLDFSNLDGNQIGKAIGQAIADAANTLVKMAGKIGSALGEMFSKVDWGELGRQAGKQIPLFLVGLTTGLLNFDPVPIFKFMADHWFEVLLGLLTIAFAPAKFARPLEGILTKIPFVGKFLAASVRWLNELGGKVKGIVGDFARSFWKGFLEKATFPGAGLIRGVLKALGGLPGRVIGFIRGLGETVYLKGLYAFERLGQAAGKAQSAILSKIGSLIGKMLSPFKSVASKMFQIGVDMIRGLISGIASMAKSAADAAANVVKGALDRAKGFLNINSPSRVFRDQVGVPISEGIGAGIKKARPMTLKAASDTVQEALDAARSKLKSAVQARNQFAAGFQGFATSLFSTDLSTTSTDAFGNEVTTPVTAGAILAFQRQQAAQAAQIKRAVSQLVRKGLSPALLKQLQAAGPEGFAQIQALAGASPHLIRQLNAAQRATSRNLRKAGTTAADDLFAEQIKQDRRDANQTKRLLSEIRDLLREERKNKHEVIEVKIRGNDLIAVIRKNKRTTGAKP